MRQEVKELRTKKSISAETLANALGVSASMVRKCEAGIRTPSVSLAERWAKFLHISDKNIWKYFFKDKADNMCKHA